MSKKQADESLNIFDLIDQLCGNFRKQWKSGQRPRIESFLDRVPKNARANLFRNLLQLEVPYRDTEPKLALSADYHKRFPEYATLIRQVLDEPSLQAQHGASGSTPDDALLQFADTIDSSAVNRIGDYQLVGELGRGGFGVVYEAIHTQRGNRVALKTLPTGIDGQQVNADRLYRFRREFRRLSEINHPNLVGMQSLEVEGSQWFFTMDLVAGQDFLEFVRPNNQLNQGRLRTCLAQLTEGVLELHRLGIIHRDLKPSNVLVGQDGHVTILDFGLAAELQRATDLTQTRSGLFAGTPRYAAPEQMFGERTEASDWYAVGTMMYEALIGKPPFHGKDQVTLLRRKQTDDPSSLVERDDVPRDLAELADGLVRREPNERLSGNSILERIGELRDTRLDISTRESFGHYPSVDDEDIPQGQRDEDIVLVGRDNQLSQLEELKNDFLATGLPQIAWVSGLSGEGKSALVEQFVRTIRHSKEMLVLSGRCYDRESVPFKVIDCWIDSLVSHLRGSSESIPSDALPGDLAGLAQIFPILRRVPAIARLPSIDSALLTPETLRHRSFLALRELLKLVSKKAPILLAVDDLQWGDSDSLDAFQRILALPDAPPILLLGCFRRDEAEQSHFLRAWKEADFDLHEITIEVGPLTLEQSRELFSRFAPILTDEHERQIRSAYQESGGNVFLLNQLLESFDHTTKSFRPIPLRDMIENRLTRLPTDARAILEMLSVFGKAIAVAEVGPLAGLSVAPFDTLTRMRSEKLIRELGSGKQQMVDTFHDQIREIVVGDLNTEVRCAWHRKIGSELRREHIAESLSCRTYPLHDEFGQLTDSPGLTRLFDIAFHLFQADDPDALDFLILAAEESLRSYSNEEADKYFNWARRVLPEDASPSHHYRVLSGLAETQLRRRNALESVNLSRAAAAYASTKTEQVQCLLIEAKGYASLGELNKAIASSDRALLELGRPRPKSLIRKLWRTSTGILKAVAVPEFQFRSSKDRRGYSIKEFELYSAMKWVHFNVSALDSVLDSIVGANSSAFSSRVPELVTLGHSGTCLAVSFLGFGRMRGIPLARVERRAKSFSTPQMRMIACTDVGISFYAASDLEACEKYIRVALHASSQSGDVFYGTGARHFVRHIYAWNHPSSSELAAAEDELKFSQDSQNLVGEFWGLYACGDALARAGRLAESSSYIQRAWNSNQGGLGSDTTVCYCTEAFLMLQASQYDRARTSCEQGWSWLMQSFLFVDYTARALPLWIEACLGPRWHEGQLVSTETNLRRLSLWMRFLYRNLQTLRPLIERTWGRMAACRGKHRKAIRHFNKAVKLAGKKGMAFYQARALLDLAAIKEEGREENRSQAIMLLKEMESVIPRAESWLLGDQYDDEVVAPEFDLAAWEAENGSISSPREEEN